MRVMLMMKQNKINALRQDQKIDGRREKDGRQFLEMGLTGKKDGGLCSIVDACKLMMT